jgi:ubiquinone biosynthesis accessory factor UbiJ
MQLPDPLLGAFEIALNRYLALDAEVLRECGELQGRVIALHLREFDLTAWLLPGPQGVQVLATSEQPADVSLSGSLPAFVRLMWPQTEQAELLLSGAVKVEGDMALAERFAGLLRRVHFDFEELLAAPFGNVAAHGVGSFMRNAFGFGRHTAQVLGRDTAEYLREETRDLVHRADVQKWMDGVDALRDGVERLEARLRRLQRKLDTDGVST